MNKVILVGRLSKDPVLRSTQSGQSVCQFSIAVDRRFKKEGQPTAEFFNIIAWGKQGEVINQYLNKGQQIALNGRLQNGSYVGSDGQKRYTTDVVLEEFDFIGNKNTGTNKKSQNTCNLATNMSNPADDLCDEDFHLLADDDDVPF